MEKAIDGIFTGKIIRCGCPRASAGGIQIDGWQVTSKDKRVESQPEHCVRIHSCRKVNVYQERKGLTRFYRPVDTALEQ
jgi:hypothetical protein